MVLMLVIRSPSPWVPISDQDWESIEQLALRRTTFMGVLQLEQMERTLPMGLTPHRVLIEQSFFAHHTNPVTIYKSVKEPYPPHFTKLIGGLASLLLAIEKPLNLPECIFGAKWAAF
uniref:Protein MEI2-like 1 isoform X3 n=1 Tax=Rhizophora mucronata TaxID=61149 RepID=A0A2P2M993_RHIMU